MTLASGIAESRGSNDSPLLSWFNSPCWFHFPPPCGPYPGSWIILVRSFFPPVPEVPGWAVTSQLGHTPISEPFADATWTWGEDMVPAKPQGWRMGKR